MASARADQHEFLEPDEDRAWHGLLSTSQAVLRSLDARLRAEVGLTVTEFDVLITLFNAPDARLGMTALASRVMLSPSGLTHLVTRMERDGLLRREVDSSDGRKFHAVLTDEGDERLRRARLSHNDVLRHELLDRLSGSERRTLAELSRFA
jgi:DNA-binding MarR family transcriptional regulator